MTDSHSLAPRPCKCGGTVLYRSGQHGDIHSIQLFCSTSGKPVGAFLAYTKPEDREIMAQAGVDGWNLAL